MNTNIILIGPMRAGKTTVGRLLSTALQLPQVSLDKIKAVYYAETDYDNEHAMKLWDVGGYMAAISYWKPFELYCVERALQDYPQDTIIDFGAGHSVYEDPALLERAQKALDPYPYVIFLTPSQDTEESIRILQKRDLDDGQSGLPEMNAHFVRHASNNVLAKRTIYTKDKTPEQTCAEILIFIQQATPK